MKRGFIYKKWMMMINLSKNLKKKRMRITNTHIEIRGSVKYNESELIHAIRL